MCQALFWVLGTQQWTDKMGTCCHGASPWLVFQMVMRARKSLVCEEKGEKLLFHTR